MSVGYFWVGETLFWMDVGAWGCMRHYLGQVEVSGVSGTLFWLGGGRWGIILGGWS